MHLVYNILSNITRVLHQDQTAFFSQADESFKDASDRHFLSANRLEFVADEDPYP